MKTLIRLSFITVLFASASSHAGFLSFLEKLTDPDATPPPTDGVISFNGADDIVAMIEEKDETVVGNVLLSLLGSIGQQSVPEPEQQNT